MTKVADVYCSVNVCNWEIHSDGKAYSDHHLHIAAYRWHDGKWRTTLAAFGGAVVQASDLLEDAFSRYVNGIIMEPIDPMRHRRK